MEQSSAACATPAENGHLVRLHVTHWWLLLGVIMADADLTIMAGV